jgi:hypothetical protein
MTLLALAVGLALLASAWVVLPILTRRLAAIGDPIPGGILDAEARKRVALASLKEVEYDRMGGKLDDADYLHLRARLEREALLAIEAADAVRADGSLPEDFTVTHACGFANPPGSRFCSGCGARLG